MKRNKRLNRMPMDGKVSTGVANAQATRVHHSIKEAVDCKGCDNEKRIPNKKGLCPVCKNRLVGKLNENR